MQFTTLLAALASAATLAGAVPTVEKRDTWSPPVLYPKVGTVWYSGQRHNVTWDNSNPPQTISGESAIVLRTSSGPTPLILAKGFDLRTGRTEVTVPLVFEGNYTIILFGSSDNFSKELTILGSGL